jgi:hypothetical protein
MPLRRNCNQRNKHCYSGGPSTFRSHFDHTSAKREYWPPEHLIHEIQQFLFLALTELLAPRFKIRLPLKAEAV